MALRLARACTARRCWCASRATSTDGRTTRRSGWTTTSNGSAAPGLLEEIAGNVLLASSDDVGGTRALLESRTTSRR